MSLDLNDSDTVNQLIKDFIAPYFHEFGPQSREIVKNSIIYALSSPTKIELLTEVVPHHELPIIEVNDVPALFEKLWTGLFNEPLLTVENLKDFVVSNDVHEANLVKIR